MVQAWYLAPLTVDADPRDAHKTDPERPVSLEQLRDTTGILYWKIEGDDLEASPQLAKIREERGYNYKDFITVSPDRLPNYETKIKAFFEEHLHSVEEFRLCLEGSGYFDVRERADQWVRVLLEPGDLIVLPAGIYHRFTCDSKNYIKACRLFVGDPELTEHNRGTETDDSEARQQYLAQLPPQTAA